MGCVEGTEGIDSDYLADFIPSQDVVLAIWCADYGALFGFEVLEEEWAVPFTVVGRDVDLPVRKCGGICGV